MFRGKKPQGFTIIEVMIFLTVSGLLFLSAITLIGNEQGKTEFSQSIHLMFSRLQSLTNNVQVGYYNFNNEVTCSVGSPITGDPVVFALAPPNSDAQGANLGCIFIGQFIQFAPGGNTDQYSLYTVVGRQYQGLNGSAPVVDIDQARPTVLPPQLNSIKQYTSIVRLPAGLQIGSVSYSDPSQPSGRQYTSLVGFITSFAAQQQSTGTLRSGSESVDLYPLPVTQGNSPVNPLAPNGYLNVPYTALNGLPDTPNDIDGFKVAAGTPSLINQTDLNDGGVTNTVVDPQDGVEVCFISSSTNQVGIVNIGVNGNPVGMQLSIQNGGTCPTT